MWNSVVIVLACLHISTGSLWSCTQDAQCSDVTGAVCAGGACSCPSGQQVIAGRCVDSCLHISTGSLWSCTQDAQCSDVTGAVCAGGACSCPSGQQVIAGRCVDLAVYHTAACVEDHQCARLFVAFECRKEGDSEVGLCRCQEGFHFFHGRCWRTAGFGASCTQDEECLDVPRDPYSLRCADTCVCAEGYYLRQRRECRKIGYAVGDRCVLDEDCQFTDAVCEFTTLSCQLSTGTRTPSNSTSIPSISNTQDVTLPSKTVDNVTIFNNVTNARSHGSYCPCPESLECEFGSCVCPRGYYGIGASDICYAELGSPSTVEQCYGILAEVVDGVCKCPANYFYEENMRDCIRVARRITDACGNDDNCLTYGVAAICGPPDEALWGQRSCVCNTELSVWDADRQMCRLFAGVGESCEIDSDCLAGELEIQCVIDEDSGEGQCTCPEGLLTVDGLCLTTGLAIGDACQATLECTETPNTACLDGQCACDSGYQQEGDFCAPIIGGTCELDEDCVIGNTVCFNNTSVLTCQCKDSYVAYNETCWPVAPGHQGSCTHSIQCTESLGDDSLCVDARCECHEGFHHRDGGCWPLTALFESCSRTSQCYLPTASERAVCRNGLCQCDFVYPYSEEDRTCASFASSIIGSTVVMMSALLYLMLS